MIQSYPWYIADWRESETRIRLSLPERALYRELLDYCYLEGSIPSDHVQLSRIAGCTVAEIKRYWPSVEILFYRKDERLFHAKVDEVRKKLEAYHEQKRHAGSASGRTRRQRSLERNLNVRSTGDGTKDEPSPSPSPSPAPAPVPIRASRDPTPTQSTSAAASEYPLTASALSAADPTIDGGFAGQIINACVQAYVGVDDARFALTDELLAQAVGVAAEKKANGSRPKAGLLMRTVPNVITNWARQGLPMPRQDDNPKEIHYDQF